MKKPNLYNIFLQIQPYKDNRWKTPTHGGNLHPRKKQKNKLLSKNPKENSHTNIKITSKITGNKQSLFLNIS